LAILFIMKDLYLLSTSVVLLVLILSGCSSTNGVDKNMEMIRQNTALQEKNSEMAVELNTRKAQTSSLQQQVFEKNAEIDRLKTMQKGLGKEVARIKTKMHVPESKAEAVTVLAEIETDINTAKERAAGDLRQSFDKPDQLMAESKSQLDQGHYDRACSLAGEALEMVQAMELKTETIIKQPKGPMVHFVFPLAMQLIKKSNIREYPSTNAQIRHSLDQKTRVTATGHDRSWIRIAINNQQLGWIHSSLLTLPEI
jgi:hypothetical protein